MKVIIVFKNRPKDDIVFDGPIKTSIKDGVYIITMPNTTLKYPLDTIEEIVEEGKKLVIPENEKLPQGEESK